MLYRSRKPKETRPAELALAEARRHLRQVQARDPEVRELAANLRAMREDYLFEAELQTVMAGVDWCQPTTDIRESEGDIPWIVRPRPC